jgi:exopolysaccharide biosynthesis WecB/TagA/CpsF family protein
VTKIAKFEFTTGPKGPGYVSAEVSDTPVPRAATQRRLLDFGLVAMLMVIVSPVIVLRAFLGFIHTGRIFDRVECVGLDAEYFHLLEFTGPYPGARLAYLLNALAGQLALVGPRPYLRHEMDSQESGRTTRFSVRPGIFSLHKLRRQTGIDYEDEAGADYEQIKQGSIHSYLGILARSVLIALIGDRRRLATRGSVTLLGIEISNSTMAELLDWIVDRAQTVNPTHLAFVNADCLNVACRDPEYRGVLDRAQRIVADGIGVRLGCKMKRLALTANLNGTDLFPVMCERLAEEGLSIYLLGAREGIAEAAGKAMQTRFPGLKIAGTYHGYFSEDDESDVVAGINTSGADVVLVAMGAPRQELWLARHADELLPPLRMGVGGLFDFYSGRIQRAPRWVREIGMEWAYRICQEPGRMWRRYVLGNPLFLYRVWREALRDRADQAPGSMAETFTPSLDRAVAGPLLKRSLRRGLLCSRDAIKRLTDLVACSLLLLLLSPLLATVALLIRLESRGPVLFKQSRVGRHGKTFSMWKFRSMYQDADKRKKEMDKHNEMRGGVLFKMKRDPRITRVGNLIRKTSIDELPQLWNVVRGEMSLVGPRPALPDEVDEYQLLDRRRLELKPGITCFWQISGRSEIPFSSQVELDVEYIHHQGLFNDLRILIKTIPAVISGRGAY